MLMLYKILHENDRLTKRLYIDVLHIFSLHSTFRILSPKVCHRKAKYFGISMNAAVSQSSVTKQQNVKYHLESLSNLGY